VQGSVSKRPSSYVLIIGVIVAVVLLAGLNRLMNSPSGEYLEHEHAHEHEAEHQQQAAQPPPPPPPPSAPARAGSAAESKGRKDRMVEVVTDRGTFRIRLFEADMPVTTANFVDLVQKKFYDNLTFHRVEDWVIQGGDPKGDGTGGSGRNIKLEINRKTRWGKPGQVGMARAQDPDSASSQWFITTKPAEWLNPGPQTGAGYALFGEVVEGMDVVRKLQRGDRMKTVRLVEQSPQK
jgi:cyclophilin family peptidyl-prolyl cis-trans isomerase